MSAQGAEHRPDVTRPKEVAGVRSSTTDVTTTGLTFRRLEGDEPALAVSGEIDVATSPLLRSELSVLLGGTPTPTRVTLDFAQVSFIDSSGLGVLVGALKRLRDRAPDAVLHVARTQGPVRNVFGITGLDELFDLS